MEELSPDTDSSEIQSLIKECRNAMGSLCDERKPSHAAWFLLTLFAISRIIYDALGLRFYAGTLDYFVQFADPLLLKTDLLRTVFHLHALSPLFNFAVGIVLKIFPAGYPDAFHAAYLVMGALFTLALYFLMTNMGVSRPLALVIAAIHAMSPTTARYECWLFESYPMALAFCAAAWSLNRYLRTGEKASGAIFFWVCAMIVLARTNFYGLWMAVWILLAARARKSWREVAALAAPPAAIVAAFIFSQAVIFGTPNNGRVFLAGNLAARIGWRSSPQDIKELVAGGAVPPAFSHFMYDTAASLRPSLPVIPTTGVPVLDNDLKSNGNGNFNASVYRVLGDAQMRGVTAMLRLRPRIYLSSFAGIPVAYASPAGDQSIADGLNTPEMRKVSDLYDLLICGQMRQKEPAWILCFAMPALLIYGLVRLGLSRGESAAFRLTLAFALFNILLVSLTTILVSFGDYSGCRFDIDGFYSLLLGLAVTDVLRAWPTVDWARITQTYPIAIHGHR